MLSSELISSIIQKTESGRCLEEKHSPYDELKCEWDVHSADNNNNNGYFCLLFFRRAHSPFIKKYLNRQQQRCEHRIRKNKQIKSTVHDANKKMK